MFKHTLSALLVLCCLGAPVLAATPEPAAATQKVSPQVEKTVPKDPLAGHDAQLIQKYYLTHGSTYEKVTKLLQSLDKRYTQLEAEKTPYYFRVDKELTDKYLRHVRVYQQKNAEQLGDYLVAKDLSSVWRLDGKQPGMIYGSAKKLLKKSHLVIYPRYLALGSKGIVTLETPGHLPYQLKARSLNESIATIGAKNTIIPKQTGQVDILADIQLGDVTTTASRRISVVTQADLQRMAEQAYLTQIYLDNTWRWHPWGPYW